MAAMATTDYLRTSEELRAAGDRLRAARAEERDARQALDSLIVAAARAGVPQSLSVTLSGLSRETVRVIERAGGVEPAPYAIKKVGHN